MPKREQLLRELSGENSYGVFLMLQMDSVPETLQLVVATTELDKQRGGFRDVGQYVIRALGVVEHRVSVGLFRSLRFVEDHPLLYQYNTTPHALFFRGKAPDPNALLVDVLQSCAMIFGPWRQVSEYLNTSQPLLSLLASEGGLLGQMPEPLARNLSGVLEKHGLETLLQAGDPVTPQDEHGRSQLRKALILDDSYVIALDFTVDQLGKV